MCACPPYWYQGKESATSQGHTGRVMAQTEKVTTYTWTPPVCHFLTAACLLWHQCPTRSAPLCCPICPPLGGNGGNACLRGSAGNLMGKKPVWWHSAGGGGYNSKGRTLLEGTPGGGHSPGSYTDTGHFFFNLIRHRSPVQIVYSLVTLQYSMSAQGLRGLAFFYFPFCFLFSLSSFPFS